jgi:cytochrome c peroxidase
MKKYVLWSLVILSGMLGSCSKDTIEEKNYTLDIDLPDHFPKMTYDINANPPTKFGFELGKKLFYDGQLSSDGFVSCGFCHEQRYAFTHHGHTVSHGVQDRAGSRNAQAIQNMAFEKEYMWDGAASHLDLQPIIPLTAEVEMDMPVGKALDYLKANKEYQFLFGKAFENGKIDSENFLKALAQFMVMMISSQSKYDLVLERKADFNSDEKEGQKLFTKHCSNCHSGSLQTNNEFINNGLPIHPKYKDEGRKRVTEDPKDAYKFRVPSLRNVEYSAPYMHDGRFGSLESVLNFYANGVTDSPTLHPSLKENGLGLSLNKTEQELIIVFLKTLSDEKFLTDKRFSEY